MRRRRSGLGATRIKPCGEFATARQRVEAQREFSMPMGCSGAQLTEAYEVDT